METELEGLPVLMPLVDIHTIGAGGGSLAWLEAGGLRVGPQSRGRRPGPGLLRARRARSRRSPTRTSSSVGSIPATSSAGACRSTRSAAAARTARRSDRRSGSDDVEFAEGMLAIINAKMADAMRTITVKQGIDPREYSLVAFGGRRADARRLARRGARDPRGDRARGAPARSPPGACSRRTCATTSSAAFYRPLAELDAG